MNLGTFFFVLFTLLIVIVAYQQWGILKNQKTQMKQQFHSDLIALASLFGEDGLKVLSSATDSKNLSGREIFATALLLQRCVTAYWIKDAFINKEWEMIVKEIQHYISRSPLLRSRWEEVKKWYPKETQDFVDNIIEGNKQR